MYGRNHSLPYSCFLFRDNADKSCYIRDINNGIRIHICVSKAIC